MSVVYKYYMEFTTKNLILDTYGLDHVFLNIIMNESLFENRHETDYWTDVARQKIIVPQNFFTRKNKFLDGLKKWYYPTNETLNQTMVDLFRIASNFCTDEFQNSLGRHIQQQMEHLSLYHDITATTLETTKNALHQTMSEGRQIAEIYDSVEGGNVFEKFFHTFRKFQAIAHESKREKFLSDKIWNVLSNSEIISATVKGCQQVMQYVVKTNFNVSAFGFFREKSNINPFHFVEYDTQERVDTISMGSGFTNSRFWQHEKVLKYRQEFAKQRGKIEKGAIQFEFQKIQQMFFYSGYQQGSDKGIIYHAKGFRDNCIAQHSIVGNLDEYLDQTVKVRYPFFESTKFENSDIPAMNWELILRVLDDTTELEMQGVGPKDFEAFRGTALPNIYEGRLNNSNALLYVGGGVILLAVIALSLS